MKINAKTNDSSQVLRQQAQAIVAETTLAKLETLVPVATSDFVSEDIKRLLHELQVHQIELELQNEELRRTQCELADSRSRYFDLFELAPIGYCVISEWGGIEEANLSMAKLLGVEKSQLITRPFSRFILKQDQGCFYSNHKQLVESKKPRSYELRMVQSDGMIVWVQLACVAIDDGQRKPTIRIGISDITAQKLVEEKLHARTVEQKSAQRLQQESLSRLRKLSSRLPGVVFQFRLRQDGTSCMPYASDGLQSLFRVRPEEVTEDASSVFACVHPEDLDGLLATIRISSEELTPFQCDFRLLFGDGTLRWVSANSLPEREDDGSTLWHGYMKDETADHEAAIELRDAKLRLEEAQSLACIGNWSYDVSTTKSHWSKQLYHIFGFDQLDVEPTYQEMLDSFTSEDAAKLDEAVKTATVAGTPYSLVVGVRHPKAEVRFVRCEGRSRRDSAGKVVGLYGTCADVTAEVEREQALQVARDQADAANRAKSEFLANMSHEIRTPLTAILGFAELLRDDGNLDIAPLQRILNIDTITSAGQHLLAIINDILDLSKIEADKTRVEHIETPLIALLHEVEHLLRPRAIGKGVSLHAKLSTPVPDRILCDPTRLRQILMNLVGNAVKFTEEGSVVINASVVGASDNALLVIDIEDTGPGMTEEQSQTLFRAFEQADSTVTRKHGGTGLGLTISRRLANLMEGDVELFKTTLGKGSCFRLTLPMIPVVGAVMQNQIDAKVVVVKEARPEKVSVEGRILLAEDGPDNQRLLTFILEKAGATVELANNGQEALEMLDKANLLDTPYDILLSDMQMPVLDGYMLARTLRSRGVSMPIIALTAHALAEDLRKCLDAGCDDYLSKPIDKHSLLTVCAKWIAVGR